MILKILIDMDEKITLSNIDDKETMTSLEIAEITNRRHSDVMRAIRTMEVSWGKISERNFALASYKDEQGKPRPMYRLTKTECLYVATKFNDEARAKLVLRWEELELKEREKQQNLPSNYIEALEALVESEKAKQKALMEAEESKAKVKQLIHDHKTYTTSEIAKELGLKSAIQLNLILAEKHIQFKQNHTWMLYSCYSDKGYVSIKQDQLDNGKIIYDRRWTGIGRNFILDLFKNEIIKNN